MPMPFSIGRDLSLDIIDPLQGVIRFGIRTGAEFTPQYTDLSSNALDGLDRKATLPNGHRIVFNIDRADPRLEDYFAAKEANYFAGIVDPNVSITETITERDGTVTQYRYTEVSLKLTGGGSWKGNQITTQTLEGMASRKVKVQ